MKEKGTEPEEKERAVETDLTEASDLAEAEEDAGEPYYDYYTARSSGEFYK